MKIDYLSTILKTNMDIVVLAILASSIIIFGGIAVYLAEHHHEGAKDILKNLVTFCRPCLRISGSVPRSDQFTN